MWINVRSMLNPADLYKINDVSKTTKIEDLRKLLVDRVNAPVEKQKLYYRGKQLEDGHTLFDYSVQLNDTIQICIMEPKTYQMGSLAEAASSKVDVCTVKTKMGSPAEVASSKDFGDGTVEKKQEDCNGCEESLYFKVGAFVDVQDKSTGAWFEGHVIGMKKNASMCYEDEQELIAKNAQKKQSDVHDNYLYRVSVTNHPTEDELELELKFIRPRATPIKLLKLIKLGDHVMVNYNIETPTEVGYWYDAVVTHVEHGAETIKKLVATVILSEENKLEGCKILLVDELYWISNLDPKKKNEMMTEPEFSRKSCDICKKCKNDKLRNCKVCSCRVCGKKEEPGSQILCDECDAAYHIWCLTPALPAIPDQEYWYCPDCKNDENEIVKAGEKLKANSKKSKMASAKTSSTRDWGKGMACVGKTKNCTVVPSNHFGPIPGVPVGSLWKFRVQVSESGVHRPHVAGIHGREAEGAYSIVLAGGYEDDKDDGEEFWYTGSGGRDLSGNKRCAEQSCDQTLTRMNKALALNCNVPLNSSGGESKKWQKGKPVRVVRSSKGKKESKYAPAEGNRYDGIYKVVKYCPTKGKAGYQVWKYLLRRDDPEPAPWTKEGKEQIDRLNLTIQYPEGYEHKLDGNNESKKRKNSDGQDDVKRVKYDIPEEISVLINKDVKNKTLWEECENAAKDGFQAFRDKVVKSFECVCCCELVSVPVNLLCPHNLCQICIQKSFRAECYNCPICRTEMDKKLEVNSLLQDILLKLFPGYMEQL